MQTGMIHTCTTYCVDTCDLYYGYVNFTVEKLVIQLREKFLCTPIIDFSICVLNVDICNMGNQFTRTNIQCHMSQRLWKTANEVETSIVRKPSAKHPNSNEDALCTPIRSFELWSETIRCGYGTWKLVNQKGVRRDEIRSVVSNQDFTKWCEVAIMMGKFFCRSYKQTELKYTSTSLGFMRREKRKSITRGASSKGSVSLLQYGI